MKYGNLLIIQIVILLLLSPGLLIAQSVDLPFDYVINNYIYHTDLIRIARLDFENTRLTYEIYRKGFLPELSFNVSPLSLSQQIKSLQDPTDGSYNYVKDYVNNASGGFSLRQSVPWTDGNLTVSSNINMLSELSIDRYTFSTTPYSISYNQSLFGGYRRYRYRREIEEKTYENALKTYTKTVADVQHQATVLYMETLLAGISYETALRNHEIADTLFVVSRSRLENKAITRQEYLQLELEAANSAFEVENHYKNYRAFLRELLLFLNIPFDEYEVEMPHADLPEILDYGLLETLVYRNNPKLLEMQLSRIKAEESLYSSKMANRFNSSINLSYGVNQYAGNFWDAYRNPSSRQNFSVSFQIPVFNWGNNGRQQRIARNDHDKTLIRLDKEEKEFFNNLREMIDNYNADIRLMKLSERSSRLSQSRYEL